MDMERQRTILELDEYIASCKKRLKTIISALDWTEEDTLKESTCSKISSEKQNENKDDPFLPESFDCMHSVVIGENQLKVILKTDNVSLPKKFSDIQLNYTREQKRELYDYVIYNTGKISEPELKVSVSNDNQSGNDMTFAEIVAKAKKKDKKLKRKYRTSKPTHIEEVRNLVHLQMEALEQYFNSEPSTTECEGRRKYRDEDVERSRRRSRSRSGERGRSSYVRRKRRSRSRDRKEKGSRNRDLYNRSRDIRSTSKGKNYRMQSRSVPKDKRRTESRSPVRATSRRKEIHKRSSTKKSKKRPRSHSKIRQKSSKSRKSKHKHRELEIKKETKEKQS